MNPLLARILIFLALVATAMLIIIAVASVSHAAECEPPPKLFFIWDIGEPCPAVHHKRHHHSRAGRRASGTAESRQSTRRTVGSIPATGAKIHKIDPEHEKLFREFEDWLVFGTR